MPTYWIMVDGQHVRNHESKHELTDSERHDIAYKFAKKIGLTEWGSRGVKLIRKRIQLVRAQTQEDFPVYKMRQGACSQ